MRKLCKEARKRRQENKKNDLIKQSTRVLFLADGGDYIFLIRYFHINIIKEKFLQYIKILKLIEENEPRG